MNIKKRVCLYGILACLVNFAILHLFDSWAPQNEFGFIYTPNFIKLLLILVTAVLIFVLTRYAFWPAFRFVLVDDVGSKELQRQLVPQTVFLIFVGLLIFFLFLLFLDFVFSYSKPFSSIHIGLGKAMSLILVFAIAQSKIVRTLKMQLDTIWEGLLRR